MSDDLYAIIADQAETIDQLRAELTEARADGEEWERSVSEQYYAVIYDRIRAAWDRWALTELGTASPSPIDLAGRGELADLWEAVK